MADDLTDKQKMFIAEYLSDGRFNASAAAKRAGYSDSFSTSGVYVLLKEPAIKTQIDKEMAERFAALSITKERVLEEISKMAFANVGDYYKIEDGVHILKDISELTREETAAIIEINSNGVIKLADKGLNLERLGRNLKLFTDKQEIDGNVTTYIASRDADGL